MKKLLTLIKPLSIAILSLLVVTVFFRYYLYINSNQLIREFKNQNFREIYSMDTLKVSSRLNSLSSVINWVCLEGSVDGKPFYKMERGSCQTGFFQQKHEIQIPQANKTIIAFTIRLPKEVELLFAIFFALQIFLIVALIFSTRKSEEEKREGEIKISKLARQMSHDVRSPLATLNTILYSIENISKKEKDLIEKSIKRINDISNALLVNTRKDFSQSQDLQKVPRISNVNLYSLLEEVVSEKKVEYSSLKNVSIHLNTEEKSLISLIDEVEFKVLISNLINNSIEAADPHLKLNLEISLFLENQMASILIVDNGRGIPPEILEAMGKREVTTKKNGNGLGVIHAHESVKSWNGGIAIESERFKGTSIKITLPLYRESKNLTVLLDDDELVRLTWSSVAKKRNIEFITFDNSEDLLASLDQIAKSSLFYIDSELGNNVKGEDVAKELFEKGYINLFIASGYDSEHFKNHSFLKGVINKSPPWS